MVVGGGVPRGWGFGGPPAARAALGTLDGTNEGEAPQATTVAREPPAERELAAAPLS